MELFREDGCLTDEGLQAMVHGGLGELGRLETAEHLSDCDSCMDRYTALLTADVMETPPKTMRSTVMSTIWVRLMQNTYGRVAVATVAAVLALSMWKAGTLEQITNLGSELKTVLPPAQSQPAEQDPGPLGKPMETRADRDYQSKLSASLQKLLNGLGHSTDANPTT